MTPLSVVALLSTEPAKNIEYSARSLDQKLPGARFKKERVLGVPSHREEFGPKRRRQSSQRATREDVVLQSFTN